MSRLRGQDCRLPVIAAAVGVLFGFAGERAVRNNSAWDALCIEAFLCEDSAGNIASQAFSTICADGFVCGQFFEPVAQFIHIYMHRSGQRAGGNFAGCSHVEDKVVIAELV